MFVSLGWTALALLSAPGSGLEFRTRELPLDFVAEGLALGFFDADPFVDLAVMTETQLVSGPQQVGWRVAVYQGLGDASFALASETVVESGPNQSAPNPLRAVDMNVDGLDDLSALGYSGRLLPSDGTLVFDEEVFVPSLGGASYDVAYADGDGDGFPDAFTMNDDLGEVYIDLAPGKGDWTWGLLTTFGGGGLFDVGFEGSFLVVTELYDGLYLDSIVTSSEGLVANDQQFPGVFGEAVPVDLDGDGDLDVVAARPTLGGVQVFENSDVAGDGLDGTLVAGALILTGRDPLHVVAADFDGDGSQDVAVANRKSRTVSVLTNDGAGTLSVASESPVRKGVDNLEAGDLDLDGDLDLVVASREHGSLTLLLNAR